MSEDTNVCYFTWGMEVTTPCGQDFLESSNRTAVPSRVTCETCLKSQVFKDHVMLKEVGFGGNFTEFYNHLCKSVVTD